MKLAKKRTLDYITQINHKLSASDQALEVGKRALKMLGAINRNVSYKSEEVVTKHYIAYR